MTGSDVGNLMYEVFGIVIKVAGPILIVSMLIGIIISILQAATQIHEQTLTFVPKLLVIGLMLLVMGGSMLTTLEEFTLRIFDMMFK